MSTERDSTRELPPSGAARPAQGWRSIATRTLISAIIGVSLYLVLRELGLEFIPSAQSLAKLDMVWVIGFLLILLFSMVCRLYRWVHLLRPIEPHVSTLRTFGVSLIGYAALFAPMRMGEVARPVLAARDGKITFFQAAGTVVAERILDGLTLTAIAVSALWFAPPVSPLPHGLGSTNLPLFLVVPATQLALVVFASAFVAMVLFYYWRATAHRIVFNLVALISKPLATLITSQVERVSDSLQFLMSRRHGLRFVRETLAYWFSMALAIMVLLQASGMPASFFQACVIIGVMGLSTTLPGPPGFLGTYQFGAFCGIALFFPDQAEAAARFTFVSYCAQLGYAVISLLLGLWILSSTKRAAERHPPLEATVLSSAPPSSGAR